MVDRQMQDMSKQRPAPPQQQQNNGKYRLGIRLEDAKRLQRPTKSFSLPTPLLIRFSNSIPYCSSICISLIHTL